METLQIPYSNYPSSSFKYNIQIVLKHNNPDAKIYYTLD